MAIPEFTLTAGPDGFSRVMGGEELSAESLAGLSGELVPNIMGGQFLMVDGGQRWIDSVPFTLDAGGKINGDDGIKLLANDDDLDLEKPIQWTIQFDKNFRHKGFKRQFAAWTFIAPDDGETKGLHELSHVTGQSATNVTRGLRGFSFVGFDPDLSEDGLAQPLVQSENGPVPAGDAVPLPSAAVDSLLGATTVGKALAKAVDALAARNAANAATRTEVYYAKDYGVVADGTTNNLSALNTLIQNVSTAGGGVVLLPIGTIKVNGSVVMKSNVALRGHGWKSVIKLGANVNGFGVVQFSGAVTNSSLEDLKIDGDRTNLTQANSGVQGVAPGGYSNIVIRNVWVDSVNYAGILMLGDQTRAVTTQNVRIADCRITNVGAHGINAQWGVDQCWIERCTVVGHAIVYPNTPGIVNGRFAYDTHMISNYVDSTGATGTEPHSYSIDTTYGRFSCNQNTAVNAVGFGIEVGVSTNGAVVGNSVMGGAKWGIVCTSNELGYPGFSNLGVTIANNVIDGSGGGIGMYMGNPTANQACPPSRTILRGTAYAASTVTRILEGRRIYECTTAGTTDAATKPAAFGTTATADTVTDGTSVWTDRGAINAQITINGNVVRNIVGDGILATNAALFSITNNVVTNCTKSGIYIHPSANMFTLTGNDVQGNNTSLDASSSNVRILAYTGVNNVPHVARVGHNRVLNSVSGGELVALESVSGSRIDNRIPNGATLPTVAYGNGFFTQNTAATTITGFADANGNAADVRLVTIYVNDANTTFQHAASGTNTLKLRGAVNYTPPSGTVLVFAWDVQNSRWVEVSRTTPDGSITAALLNSPKVDLLKDTNGNTALTVFPTASAVNSLLLANAPATGYPGFTAQGSDTDIGFAFTTKGAGTFVITVPTGRTPTIQAKGADTNHDLNLQPKGTGVVKANGNPVGVKVAVPSSASATGVPGQWAADSSYIYVCTAANTWMRAAIATW